MSQLTALSAFLRARLPYLGSTALAVSLVVLPGPVAAKEAPLAKIAAELNDPQRQESLAGALEALGTALLDVKVAPFLRAMDRAGLPARRDPVDPNATLGDVAGPTARDMPHELAKKLPAMMRVMGTMTGEMEAMLPQLEAMGKRLEGVMEQARPRENMR